MANLKFFFGETELKGIQYIGGRAYGTPVSFTPVFVKGVGWDRGLVPVERKIEYKANPSRHECDSRCTHATGRVMKCECKCGGKNHGRG